MASFCGHLSVFIPICLQWLAWVVTAQQKNIPVWTWLDGSMLVNQSSTLTRHTTGKQYPGSRVDSAVWTDTDTGVMWMFGGRVGSGSPALNELWRYSMSSGDWTNVRHDREHKWPQSRYAAAVCGVPGSFLVVHGGAESAVNHLSDTWLYHLHNESWTLLQESFDPGAQTKRLHWCTRKALWLLTLKETTIDPNTMWRYSLMNYEWEQVSADFDDVLSRQTHVVGQRYGSTTWVVNDTELYLLGARPSDSGHNEEERCQGKKQECALWRFSTVSNKWRRVSFNYTNTKAGEVVDSDLIEFNATPGCPAKEASWQDTDGNLWLQDSSAGMDTCEKKPHARSDLWMFDLQHNRWEHFKSLLSPQYQLGYEIIEGTSDVRNHPAPRAYCASWSWNNTYYLFGGLARNGSNGALNDLWSFQLVGVDSLEGRPTSTMAISPVGVFFLSLGALCFLALLVFSIIFFSKCSTGPRLKPPNHFGDKIRYSPVETDEVFIT
ncbi:uncharacterized protein LOC117292249 [Asterias rubens]|uniref:uncharacterized protein LOC117292249 n=1 Tax=Asterias rubens TaxID=7604 RepID=UPI0014556F5E|nr:uncharacterized protein LOC117292249 [Asterias rubens]XP_033630138.1 uncharacterized protein LOC117292249 [Asterias rubens]XP_033630147.1 uncharacterized protein LOC117292249 [Asterias rubens]